MQRRGYVAKHGGSLEATARGRLLSAFLAAYFQRYVDYGFTASMEDSLDAVSGMSLWCVWRPVILLPWLLGGFQCMALGCKAVIMAEL